MRANRDFNHVYDLDAIRADAGIDRKRPLPHQQDALDALHRWFGGQHQPHAGGLLVLPTGAGKTYTTVRFLCGSRGADQGGPGPLSLGYKVLWLAHTHHLLEQAFVEFANSLQLIRAPRASLGLRVVSGAPRHHHVQDVRIEDDVLIATLQTIRGAVENRQRQVLRWLEGAGEGLFIVFDEAHHSPAPTYRNLVLDLLQGGSSVGLLGLTATPTYSDETRRPWLGRLFPQGIIHQEAVAELMLAGILARPRPRQLVRTKSTPKFEPGEFDAWATTRRDLPEHVIAQLADNRARNALIADTYAASRDEFGPTIMFADRREQCDQIVADLKRHQVRAGAVYSQGEGGKNALEGNRSELNARILEDFRQGNLDVIVNIRMLTEGTDLPSAQTAFMTRQTTSQILLTQMVGRVLRGPKMGGTKDAHLVFFADDWQQNINWAEWELLDGVETVPDPAAPAELAPRPVVELLSADLLRKLAEWMEGNVGLSPVPFWELIPAGWYQVEYEVLVNPVAGELDAGSGDVPEFIRRLVLVFDRDRPGFERMLDSASPSELGLFADVVREEDETEAAVTQLLSRHFATHVLHGPNLALGIEDVMRHLAQQGVAPPFVPFEAREEHDLDGIAASMLERRVDRLTEDLELREQFGRGDRLWKLLFRDYERFKLQYTLIAERLVASPEKVHATLKRLIDRETQPADVPEDLKREINRRDGGRCLCCGAARYLQVDHIQPRYRGGSDEAPNLQTLCRRCNRAKGIETMDFRSGRYLTPLTAAPERLPTLALPSNARARDVEAWQTYLRGLVNLFYGCAAVKSVAVTARGRNFHTWEIELHRGNRSVWFRPHLDTVLGAVQSCKRQNGLAAPSKITIRSAVR